MPTLLLPPRYTSDSIAMWRAGLAAGWRVERLPSWRIPEEFSVEEPVLFGEPLFAEAIADQLGIALIEPPLSWLTTVPEYRRRAIRLLTLGEARSEAGPVFVKPADDKCFPAKVYSGGAALPHPDGLPEDTPVLVAEPVEWELEVRYFVLDRKVLTLSPYLRHGELADGEDESWPIEEAERSEALEMAQRILDDPAVSLPPAVALDVGRIRDRGWAVIELNAAWGSGIYGCNPSAVLKVVRRTTIPKNELSAEDRRWTRS